MLNLKYKFIFSIKYRLIIFTLLTSVVTSSAYAQRVLRVGTAADIPPFSYLNEKNELAGFDFDIGNAICEQIEVKCEWTDHNFEDLIPALQAGKLDMVVASMTITDERKNLVSFTDKYYSDAMRLIVPADLNVSDDLKELEGKKIGVLSGTNVDAYSHAVLVDQGVRVIRYDRQLAIYEDLLTNKIQGAFDNGIAAEMAFLAKPYGEDYKFTENVYDDPQYFGLGIGIAVKRGNSALVNQLNTAIKTIRENGKYQEIQGKYFTNDIYGH